jgi:hypothetical protein
MKNKNAVTVRYMGADHARTFVLQRGDYAFWTGSGWDEILDNAKVFYTHQAAQKACAAIQYRQHRGKPVRTFTVEMTVTLAADDVQAVSHEALARFVAEAVRIDIENAVYGDGPVDGSFVQARLKLKTLEETKPRRSVF